ncbi:amidohydrolase family protein [Devosia albogilva]|uniref:Amidohydrolase family protein n=1 Tax=Devosia albogilva TaxID=429726 RepID=A0ABW5QHE3_9HYPH
MILDCHCHVWERWPYQPLVPDAATRAAPEQLLFEMDQSGVETAVLIAAAIGGNPRNADFAFAAAQRYPGRFVVFPDLECFWSPDYGEAGASGRLQQALERWDFAGFTVYLAEDEDGSRLTAPDGLAFFTLAAERRLIVSLSAWPHQLAAVVDLAQRLPTLVLLLHHFAFFGPRSGTGPDLRAALASASACGNIHVKYSGMGNVAAPEHDYPYASLGWLPLEMARAFGSSRMLWGSDWPVSQRYMTYRQSLMLLKRHGPFSDAECMAVGGNNMMQLLTDAAQGRFA